MTEPSPERPKRASLSSGGNFLSGTELRDLYYNAVLMGAIPSLGEFEQVVLLAILRLDNHAYGVTVRLEIIKCTGREPSPGALYTTLDRLEEKGFVTSSLGDPTPERGGRAKRFFTVTKKGAESVGRAQRAFQRLLKGIELPGGVICIESSWPNGFFHW
jgi:PadR family transcriptional regulator, regulatory protein PadR